MITSYWNNLQERERWMLVLGSLLAMLYLFYLLIYSPLSTAVDRKGKELIEKTETLAWMQQVSQQANTKKPLQKISNARLLALMSEQLNKNQDFHLFPYQLQQTGSGELQLSFDKVPFNLFLSWLWSLKENYDLGLKQFVVEKTETPGVVKLLVVIAAA